MCRQADAANVPGAIAISLVFGGCTGTLVAAAFGLGARAGFVGGACLLFLFLWVSVLRGRQVAAIGREPPPREAGGDQAAAPAVPARPASR